MISDLKNGIVPKELRQSVKKPRNPSMRRYSISMQK